MQKWEYLILAFHLDFNGGYSIDGKVFSHEYPNSTNEEYPVLTFKTLMFNQFGDKGWELVSENGQTYVFKRQK